MTATISLNGLDAVSVRLFQPWQGVWVADVDFDLAAVPVVPSGPCTLLLGTTPMLGTVDPEGSGKFGEKARARVIGGGGGWHKLVSARHFHNDAGVLSTAVIGATAAEVGEKTVVIIPARLGVDYERVGGFPASQVLAGLDWYVTTAGVTTVGPRTPLPATPDVDVLTWDAQEQRAELATDSVVAPGTVLIDPRFGTATVRDVEQTFDASGTRATAWCGTKAASKLATMLRSLVRSHGRTPTLTTYRYRVVLQNSIDGRLTLQAVSKSSGAPDSISLPPWYGVPGVHATIEPGTECSVVFLDGDPAQPVVVNFQEGDVTQIQIGRKSLAVPVALAPLVQAFITAFNIHTHATGTGPTSTPAVPFTGSVAATKLASE